MIKFLASINSQSNGWAIAEQTKKNRVIWLANYDQCEGKDSGNYSRISVTELDAQCSESGATNLYQNLMVSKANGENAVLSLAPISSANYPAGGKKIKHYLGKNLNFNSPS